MTKFAMGMVCGLLLGLLGTGVAADLVGGDGFLTGWTVTIAGEQICADPWIVTSLKRIEC